MDHTTQIKEKLKIIEELFPAERLEKSKQRIRALYEGKILDRLPYVNGPVTMQPYHPCLDPMESLINALDEIIIRGQINDDYIPQIFPGCRQSTIPNMFGAKEIEVRGGDNKPDYSAEKLDMDVIGVDKLPEPSMAEGTVAGRWLDIQKQYLELTEGKIGINVVDMQGPVDVIGQLYGYDSFFILAYEDPDAAHLLMKKMTDAFILFWQAQKNLLGENFVATHLWGWYWMPHDLGATLSMDALVMFNSDFYNEFIKPYMEQIASVFGGLSIHSCGSFPQNIKAVCETKGLLALNSSQMSTPDIAAAGFFSNKVLTIMRNYNDIETVCADLKVGNIKAFLSLNGMPLGAEQKKERDEIEAKVHSMLAEFK